MLFSYNDCLNKYGNHYQLEKMFKAKKSLRLSLEYIPMQKEFLN